MQATKRAPRIVVRIREAAAMLDCSSDTIRRLIKAQTLEGFRLGNGITHVSTASIRKYLEGARCSFSPSFPIKLGIGPDRAEIEHEKATPGQTKI